MSFNELPSLFFLYENFITKRFESITKNDPKKFEEFRKIHQYYSLKNLFYSLKLRDVTMNKEFDANNLDIFKNKVNWTDDEVIRYGFLTNDTEASKYSYWNRSFKFHEKFLADFFVAEYFYDNLIKPKDSPSDDEMELRIRFFFHIIANSYDRKPLPNEFIKGMIEDQKGEIFNDQVRMIMKYRFRNLLDSFLPGNLDYVEKISSIFGKDEEMLKNLWRVDENEPYFLRFFRFTSSYDNVYKLKEIAEKFFKIGNDHQVETDSSSNLTKLTSNSKKPQADNIFSGKNQILNVLYRIYQKNNENFTKNILDVTKYKVNDEILTKLSTIKNFLDFVDSSNFTPTEKREYYWTYSDSLISNARNGSELIKLWKRMQNYFDNKELKKILTQKEPDYNYTQLFMLPSHNDQSYVETFFNLTKFNLNNDEIKDFLQQRAPISGDSFIMRYILIVTNLKIFEINYNFAKNHLDHEELRSLLFNSKPVDFIRKVSSNKAIFRFCMNITAEFYTNDEIRDFLMQTDDEKFNILFWGVRSSTYTKNREDIINYLKEIFKGQKDKLKELFRMRDYAGETVLGSFNRNYNKDGLKPFLEFAEELFTKEEIEELKNAVKESN